MTFASSWTRLQGSWFPSSVCVTCSWSIGNAITAVRLMQRYRLLREQCNSEVSRYIKKHRPKLNLPVASHLFLLIILPLINKRNHVPSSIKGLEGTLGRLGHCLEPWACTASFHWGKGNSHKSTRVLWETTGIISSPYSVGEVSSDSEPRWHQRQCSDPRGAPAFSTTASAAPPARPAGPANTPSGGAGTGKCPLPHPLLLWVFFDVVEVFSW